MSSDDHAGVPSWLTDDDADEFDAPSAAESAPVVGGSPAEPGVDAEKRVDAGTESPSAAVSPSAPAPMPPRRGWIPAEVDDEVGGQADSEVDAVRDEPFDSSTTTQIPLTTRNDEPAAPALPATPPLPPAPDESSMPRHYQPPTQQTPPMQPFPQSGPHPQIPPQQFGTPQQFSPGPQNDQPRHYAQPQPQFPPQSQPQMQPSHRPYPPQGSGGQPQSGDFRQRMQPPPTGPGQPIVPSAGNGNLTPPPGLDQIRLIQRSRKAPQSGWRRAVHSATGGVVNLGDSAHQQHIDALIERVRQPIRGDYRLAVLSLKGGVGKTTTTIGLGSIFASLRGDRVIAVDANPDLGTLASRVPQQTQSNVRGLLNDPNVVRYSDVRAHTSQARSRLEVLASERDPAVSEAFSEADYRRVVDILRNHYNIVLTDCGTGLMHSAMKGVLELAHGIVLVTSPAIDGAQSASATLDWLNHHGHERLVSQSVVVISSSKPGSAAVDIDMMAQHFLGRTRAVQVIPYDNHLAEGSQVDLDLIDRATRDAFIELGATIADGFPVTVGMPPNGAPPQWKG